jgi:hypothetical protein
MWNQPTRRPSRRGPATPTTACRKPEQCWPRARFCPCSFPRSRSNLQHRPDGHPGRADSATAVPARLAERGSRRHTRSPGEAGGGRSDLCHDNDESDPVNRRTRVGDNPVEVSTEFPACECGPFELVGGRVPPRNEQLPTDLQERKPQLGDDRKGSERSRRCGIKRLAARTTAIVLEPRVNNREVGEVKLGGGGGDPVQAAALRVNQGEGRRRVRDGQRQARQSGTRSEVHPAFAWLGSTDRCQAKRVVEVPLPEPFELPRTEEPGADRLRVGPFQSLRIARGQGAPLGCRLVGQCFT